MGVPVIAGRDSGAVPWVVGDNGRLVDVSSARAIALALLELLADESLRLRLGSAGRKDVERRFAVSAVCRAYEALYRSALAPGRIPVII
jgi:glycosyltransferase involved in cell wall biosynthesis